MLVGDQVLISDFILLHDSIRGKIGLIVNYLLLSKVYIVVVDGKEYVLKEKEIRPL